ncbi:MAG: PUA domain-containing protein [Sulfolobales archaeon]
MGRFDYDSELIKALEAVYGSDVFNFLESLSRPPSRYYVRVNVLKTSVDDVLRRLRDRGFEVFRDEVLDEAIYFPVKGPYEVPSAKWYVVADKKAAESVLLGSDLYVPGVIKGEFRKGVEVNVITEYGDVIAYGIAEIDSDSIGRVDRGIAVRVVKSRYDVVKIRELPEFKEGLIYPQSLPSMLVCALMDPKAGEVIVDMCAAPGGKTGHLVERSYGRALVYAFDHSKKKVERMVEELSRLGHIGRVKVFKADSRYLDVDFSWLRADKVVVDPPCSALGVIPKLYDSKRYSDIKVLSEYQFQFLKTAAKVVREGGLISYSTCTVTLEEGEELVERTINQLGLEVIEPKIRLGSSGITSAPWGMYLIRFHPHIHGVPGYFISLLRRRN